MKRVVVLIVVIIGLFGCRFDRNEFGWLYIFEYGSVPSDEYVVQSVEQFQFNGDCYYATVVEYGEISNPNDYVIDIRITVDFIYKWIRLNHGESIYLDDI